MLLYYITDRNGFAGADSERRNQLLRCIAAAARAGVDFIQLREKDLDSADLELLAREALRRVRENSATTKLLINTNLEVALEAGADGVHLPANSEPAAVLRRQWLECSPRPPLVGVSAHTLDDVMRAEINGASFAVLAPIFEKVAAGAGGIGLDVLRDACDAFRVPVIALGGVRLGNARACLEAGAAGIAAIRLFQENAVSQTVEALRWLERQVAPSPG
jgi:thiamine-phosphate pyrophosphorylase